MNATPDPQVRLDKWLWAARFYKTRTLAQQAIEGGKVHVNGSRTKPGHPVRLDHTLEIRVGTERYEVQVRGLSDKRGPAKTARALYEETEESRRLREQAALERKAAMATMPQRDHAPDRYERRRIQQLMQTKWR